MAWVVRRRCGVGQHHVDVTVRDGSRFRDLFLLDNMAMMYGKEKDADQDVAGNLTGYNIHTALTVYRSNHRPWFHLFLWEAAAQVTRDGHPSSLPPHRK